MNGKQKITITILALSVTFTGVSLANGAPSSQFGFKGWPYRHSVCSPASSTTCVPAECPTVAPQITQEPVVIPTAEPLPTVKVTAVPTPEPTLEPTTAPEPTTTAAPTAAPTVVITPKPTVKPIVQPNPTAASKPQSTVKPTAAPSTDDDYTTAYVSTQEENAFNLLNADRISNGRSALAIDPELCRLARIKSYDMFANNYFAHTSPTLGSAADMLRNSSYSFTSVGENIAHHATVEKAQAAFMSSSGHRTNILGSQWTKVGIGVCYDSQGFVYVTQLFVR